MKKKTGSFEAGVALEGAYTSRNRQSSEVVVLYGFSPVARQIGPCWLPR